MAQGPMDHDRISSVQKALDEHKELTHEQFRDRLAILILASWLSTLATKLYLHLR